MCGPFVVMQSSANISADSNEKFSEFTRLKNSALLPYHLGRISTYIMLGSIAAYLSSHILALESMKWFAAILLGLSGLLFVSYAISKNKKLFLGFNLKLPEILENKVKPFFKNPRGLNGFALGSILGLIPCGMIIGAIFAVSSTGNVSTAFLAMALFGLGTIPGLFSVSLGSNFLLSKFKFKKAQSVAMFVSGMFLLSTAIGIFY